MTTLTIQHDTTYRYRRAVDLGRHRMMLRPREAPDLRLVSFTLDLSPDAAILWTQDVAGNAVAISDVNTRSDTLQIRSMVVLELTAAVWPVFDIAASAASYPFAYSDEGLSQQRYVASHRIQA